jgi:sulfite exporter TauE/SafE
MLASIHPLGERARRQRWGITVAAYLVGTLAASALVGGALGLVGRWLGLGHHPVDTVAVLAVAALAAAGVVLDLRIAGLTTPTIHRQVDERWLQRYRGWVYGGGFGFQLGLGVVTVVNTFAVYLMLAVALLAGSALTGLAVGLTFGVVRGAAVLAVARVRHPDQLRRLLRRLHAWDGASRRLAVGVQAAVAAGAVTALVVR